MLESHASVHSKIKRTLQGEHYDVIKSLTSIMSKRHQMDRNWNPQSQKKQENFDQIGIISHQRLIRHQLIWKRASIIFI